MEDFFYTGGTIPEEYWKSYVERDADEGLYQRLKLGDFCYVLTARQMGKSSLCNKTMRRLNNENYKCVYVDLTTIGKNATAEEWYFDLIDNIIKQTNLKFNLTKWWESKANVTPLSRFVQFIEDELIQEINSRIVIFIDEIDYVLSLRKDDFDTDDFFAAVRSLYMGRAKPNKSELKRINFALFGVASPNHLIQDKERTPFNIGKAIPLENLAFDKAKRALSKGFNCLDNDSYEILKAIFEWTNGQPYLTQVICKEVSELKGQIDIKESIRKIVTQITSNGKDETNSHFSNIEERITNNKLYNLKMLNCYRSLQGGDVMEHVASDATQIYLKLSGLITESNGYLKISSKIYEQFFNRKWLEKAFEKINPYYSYLRKWQEKDKKDPSTGLRVATLNDYLDWANKHQATSEDWEFIHFSEKIINKKKNRIQNIFGLFAMLLLATLGFVGYQSLDTRRNTEFQEYLKDKEKLLLNNRIFEEENGKLEQQVELTEEYLNTENKLLLESSIENRGNLELKRIELQDSLKYIYKGSNLFYNLAERRKSQRLMIDTLILQNESLIAENENLRKLKKQKNIPVVNPRVNKTKVAIVPACELEIKNKYINSGNFYSDLVNASIKKLKQTTSFIPSKDIHTHIENRELDVCKKLFKSIDIGIHFNVEKIAIIKFEENNTRLVIKLSIVDLKKETSFDRAIGEKTNSYERMITELIAIFQQEFGN